MKKRGPSIKKTIKAKIKKVKAPKRQDLRLHQHLIARYNAKKELRTRKRAEYLASMPKTRIKRILFRLHPKRVLRYWFSREGLMMALRIAGIGILLGVVAVFVVFAYYRKDLPKNITDLKACSQGQKSVYYDRTGESLLWRGEGDVDCQPVAIDQMSPYLKNAVIAAEDNSFYSHPGFDVKGTLRAAISNAKGSSGQQGGSTLTQQYVKLAVLSNNEKKLSRKVKELILSIELERTYKKDEILQAYLNEISFGEVYNGAEASSQGFFEKPAKDLTLDEAATLAAAIQAPGYYWDTNRDALIERRNNYVLEKMVSLGSVTREEADAAKQVDTLAKVSKSRNMYKDIKAPHFVLEVQRQLEEEFGSTNLKKQGYKIITTLDMNLQAAAEQAVANNMESVESRGLDNAAMVSEEVATGQVVAYVGSRDFNYPEFGRKNLAGSPRAAGSSFKPYDYASLMANSQEWGAGSILYDVNTTWAGYGSPYKPTDYDGSQPGGISMRYALGGSRNIPAVKAMYIAGIKNTHDLAGKLGLRSGVQNCGIPCEESLSTSLGDGGEIRLDEHVNAYATFSRLGKYVPQVYVLKILDAKGKVIRDNTAEPVGEQVLDPQIAYIIDDMLSDRSASYFRNSSGYRYSVLGDYDDQTIPTAIKTGTTNSRENGWMMGFTPKYATGVWIGHHEYKAATEPNMEYSTGRIWSDFMLKAHENQATPDRWAKPEGIKTVAHDNTFYQMVKSGCTGVRLGNICGFGQSDIYPSWYSAKKSTTAQQKVVIDTVSKKRATDCTPERARKELTGGGIIVPELAETDMNYKNFMTPITSRYHAEGTDPIPPEEDKDDVHSCSDVKPTITLSSPSEGGTCNNTCAVTATVTRGTKPLRNIYYKLDGQTLPGGAFDVADNGPAPSFSYSPELSGVHTLSVEVVDEGLYDSTSSATVTLTAAPPLQINTTKTGANVKFSWAYIAATSYEITVTNNSTSTSVIYDATCAGDPCSLTKTAAAIKAAAGGAGNYTVSITSTAPTKSATDLNTLTLP